MIKTLRKRHLQIWILWAVMLPVGILVAWMAVPEKVTQEFMSKNLVSVDVPGQGEAFGNDYTIDIGYDTSRTRNKAYLLFINHHKLRAPPFLIYKMADSGGNIDKQLLLGRVEKEGTQFFPLDTFIHNDKFILYDFIHKKIIDTITVKSPFK